MREKAEGDQCSAHVPVSTCRSCCRAACVVCTAVCVVCAAVCVVCTAVCSIIDHRCHVSASCWRGGRRQDRRYWSYRLYWSTRINSKEILHLNLNSVTHGVTRCVAIAAHVRLVVTVHVQQHCRNTAVTHTQVAHRWHTQEVTQTGVGTLGGVGREAERRTCLLAMYSQQS